MCAEKLKVAILYYTHEVFESHTMKLTEKEKDYIKNLCNTYTDERISIELTRIRYEIGIKDSVSVDQVRKGRYSMGIAKAHGRSVCKTVNKKESENE